MRGWRITGPIARLKGTIPTMPPRWPAHLRECTKRAVKDRDATLALWVCEEIRRWDLFIGETPKRDQPRVYLAHSQYDCLCHEDGCREMIKAGEPVLWAPDQGSWHAWHYPSECPPDLTAIEDLPF